MDTPSKTELSKAKESIRYFKLPFIGKCCKLIENELQKLTRQYCKEGTNIKNVFQHI